MPGTGRVEAAKHLGLGDPTGDSTAMWPEENRKAVKLGTMSITARESNAVCDEKTTDPVINLPEGVAGPANDPMLEIRSPAYAFPGPAGSSSRRPFSTVGQRTAEAARGRVQRPV